MTIPSNLHKCPCTMWTLKKTICASHNTTLIPNATPNYSLALPLKLEHACPTFYK